jgi:hypothetical protein
MQSQININIAVDVTKALSEQTLEKSIYMMDDSLLGSTGQGTGELTTVCQPGQAIRWVVYAIDLQTSVSIKNISFIAAAGKYESSEAIKGGQPEADPDAKEWIGILPYMEPGLKYAYRVELQMGKGEYGYMAIDTPSLTMIK